jgi:uncharacterized protein YkwD
LTWRYRTGGLQIGIYADANRKHEKVGLSASNSTRLIAIGAAKPCEFALGLDEVSIGSAAGNDLIVEESTVSRRHAKLVRDAGKYRLIDLQSTNGTFVNGRRIAGSMIVKGGDELGFGAARYVLTDESVRATTASPGGDNDAGSSVRRAAAVTMSPRRKRMRHLTLVALIAFIFTIGFALTAYLLNRNSIEKVAQTGSAFLAGTTGASAQATESIVPSPPGAGTASVAPSEHPAKGGAAATPVAEANKPASKASPLAPEITGAVMEWLGPLNYYRALVGLPPVEPDSTLSAADANHARYLVKNFGDLIRADKLGAEAHTEDPSKPWYSVAGAKAAVGSNIEEGYHPTRATWLSPAVALEGWVSLPFHRLWILNPNLRHAGYGQYCEAGVCAGALDLASGADLFPIGAAILAKPIEFPPAGGAIRMRSAEGEWPNPLTSCPGYAEPMGLPITLQLGPLVEPKLTAYALTLNGNASAAIEACAFDASTYVNPDPAQQKRVREGLRDFGAVVVIPRDPLTPGGYTVSITAMGRQYTWSFGIGR